ncbi:MAG TPA: hypothetical protein PLF48_05765, partial [Chitinophagales bacterium]|nr:hypothetical protein [Chitinophagales bacterium]
VPKKSEPAKPEPKLKKQDEKLKTPVKTEKEIKPPLKSTKIEAEKNNSKTDSTSKTTPAKSSDKKQPEKKGKTTDVPPAKFVMPPPQPGVKRKVIVDYKNVPDEVLRALYEKYPHGYNKAIIRFMNAKKEMVSAVPIELEDVSYLVKVSTQLQKMVDDYDEDEMFTEVNVPAEKEIPAGAGGDFDEFDRSDDDDAPKSKSKGRVRSADDLEYGFDDEEEEDDDDDDDDDDNESDDVTDDDDDE